MRTLHALNLGTSYHNTIAYHKMEKNMLLGLKPHKSEYI